MPEQLDDPGYLGVRPHRGRDPARIGQHMMWSGPPRRDQRVSNVAWERQVGDGSVQMPQLTLGFGRLVRWFWFGGAGIDVVVRLVSMGLVSVGLVTSMGVRGLHIYI
jgi:hypothetical protein